jgi:hypothetical protein
VVIVLDGVEGAPHDGASRPVFSPDGTRVAYIAHDGETSRLVDGEAITQVSHKATSVVRSRDGKRLAFLVQKEKGKKWSVTVDGRESPDYDDVTSVVFSNDSGRYAHAARKGREWHVVVDGVAGGVYDEVRPPVFGPDSQRYAYAARRGKQWRVVVDGTEGKAWESVGLPVFSPDGRRIAYVGRQGKQEHVVVDDAAGPALESVGVMSFSPDGGHLAYEGRQAGRWRLVVDGQVGPAYDRVADLPDLELRQLVRGWTFRSPEELWYVGRRGDEMVRWEVSLRTATTTTP